jgi:hypothetical protein
MTNQQMQHVLHRQTSPAPALNTNPRLDYRS